MKATAGSDKSKVVTVSRAEHQPVIAEVNRATVAVECRVSHIENGQRNAASR